MPDPRDFLPPLPQLPEAFFRAFELTPERIALVQRINDQIRQRTAYGMRSQVVERVPAYRIQWSNGSAEWDIYYYAERRTGKVLELDADTILVQGVKKEDIEAVLRWLEPLPLYSFSYEARQRGIFDPLGWLRALYQRWQADEE